MLNLYWITDTEILLNSSGGSGGSFKDLAIDKYLELVKKVPRQIYTKCWDLSVICEVNTSPYIFGGG